MSALIWGEVAADEIYLAASHPDIASSRPVMRHQVSPRVRNPDGCCTEDVAKPACLSAVSVLFADDHYVSVLLETDLSKQVLGRPASIQIPLQNLYEERPYFARASRKTLQFPDPATCPTAPPVHRKHLGLALQSATLCSPLPHL